MRLLIRIVVVVGVLLVALVGIGFLLPQAARVERATVVAAPPATVFALVNSFRQFDRWSPWADRDPAMKVERSGAEFGVGAKYAWSGNRAVGSGSQEIVASTPNREVRVKLAFGGFDGASEAVFTIVPEGEGSRVTWSLRTALGRNPVDRYFGLLMDRMVGPDYETGLARLKALAETLPKTDFATLDVALVDGRPEPYAYVSGSTSTEGADVGPALAQAYARVAAAVAAAGLKQAGAPIAVTRRYDPAAKVYDFDAALPVDRGEARFPESSGVRLGATPPGRRLRVTHTGPYATLGAAYGQLAAFEAAYGFAETGDSWEQFVSDPGTTPEAELVTTISVPVK